jgi:hypothetical protein
VADFDAITHAACCQWYVRQRRKRAQAMRTETVRLHGVREGRGADLCQAICTATFCPCNMPAIVRRRMRVIQAQATTFHRWIRWRQEWEHIGTPHRVKWADAVRAKVLKDILFGKSYPQG